MEDLIQRFVRVCMEDPTFSEVPSEFLAVVGDPEMGPVMAALAYQFSQNKKHVDLLADDEVKDIARKFVRAFYLESVRRMLASDRPRTFALRDARLSEFMDIERFSFSDEEAVHSMRLKIQGLLGIEMTTEDMRRILVQTVDDVAREGG